MKVYKVVLFVSTIIICVQCNQKKIDDKGQGQKSNDMKFINTETITTTIDSLMHKYGREENLRIEIGVNQAANFWTEEDGSIKEFEKFCLQSYISSDEELDLVFQKLSRNFEILWGNFNKMGVDLKRPLHLDMGDIHMIDQVFGGYSPSSHLTDDFFKNKIAFTIILNFPFYSLKEKAEKGKNWSNQQWGYARMGDLYVSRVPAELVQKVSETMTNADTYISEYNIYMGKLIDNNSKTLFPEDLKLITHWGLRDELKSNYNLDGGIEKQNIIFEVMKRIINQDIPESVINSSDNKWNPYKNVLLGKEGEIRFKPEPNTRYQFLLDNFNAMRAIDEFSPKYPTYIQRKFDQGMEISQEEVEKLFIEFISSPQVKKVAELISRRLGRKLQPFDIWYDGFKPRSSISEEELDKIVSSKYPDKESFENDLPNILTKLEFGSDKARDICSRISVDASRGAGHAIGAEMRSGKSLLRTRVGEGGMNYKGYNIATHEFGHNVEQTITLQDVDNYMIAGVPNTAFTEALAFVFQKKDLDLLGIKQDDSNKKHLLALDNFWSSYEIMGVSLVDMRVWKWMYDNPDADAEALKNTVIKIAKDIWNEYYAEAFGIRDQEILAIYSHMIDYPLYLSAYPIGHLIEFQIEQHIEGKNFAEEVQRMFVRGRIIPQLWMKEAVGKEISGEPMILAVEEALKVIE